MIANLLWLSFYSFWMFVTLGWMFWYNRVYGPRRDEAARLIERADYENEQVLSGDIILGMYGRFTPAPEFLPAGWKKPEPKPVGPAVTHDEARRRMQDLAAHCRTTRKRKGPDGEWRTQIKCSDCPQWLAGTLKTFNEFNHEPLCWGCLQKRREPKLMTQAEAHRRIAHELAASYPEVVKAETVAAPYTLSYPAESWCESATDQCVIARFIPAGKVLYVVHGGATIIVKGDVGARAVLCVTGGGSKIDVSGNVGPGARIEAVGGGSHIQLRGRVHPSATVRTVGGGSKAEWPNNDDRVTSYVASKARDMSEAAALLATIPELFTTWSSR